MINELDGLVDVYGDGRYDNDMYRYMYAVTMGGIIDFFVNGDKEARDQYNMTWIYFRISILVLVTIATVSAPLSHVCLKKGMRGSIPTYPHRTALSG